MDGFPSLHLKYGLEERDIPVSESKPGVGRCCCVGDTVMEQTAHSGSLSDQRFGLELTSPISRGGSMW